MVVNGSTLVIEIDGTNAPVTAGNFVDLVNRGVYNGLAFHRVVREPQPFVVQGGDPQSQDPNFPAQQLGTGSFVDPETQAPRYIPLEIKPAGAEKPVYSQTFEEARIAEAPQLTHTRGAVAMARSQAPDSASAQFYFTLADLPFLDGSYAVFGYVTEGMEVVDGIQQGDRIESARVVEGLDNLQTN
jgi:peptidyl-prolyl cis-trans isomerase B (cyclophilin B)